MPTVRRRPQAEEDLVEIWTFIALDNVSAADRVLDAIEETLELLLEMPEIGVRHASALERLADIRFFPVKKFRSFLIYYRPVDDGIEVVRVLRGERDRQAALSEDD